MKFFVYILQSLHDKRYYIGYTTNIENRLNYHKNKVHKPTNKKDKLMPITIFVILD